MKKFSIISLILLLILFTAFIKNSTKRIDDEIFLVKENIRILTKNFEKIKLEYDYLSSAGKLIQFQNLYFESELIKKNIQNIKTIYKTKNSLRINQFKFSDEK